MRKTKALTRAIWRGFLRLFRIGFAEPRLSKLHELHAFFLWNSCVREQTTSIVVGSFYIKNGRQNLWINVRINENKYSMQNTKSGF